MNILKKLFNIRSKKEESKIVEKEEENKIIQNKIIENKETEKKVIENKENTTKYKIKKKQNESKEQEKQNIQSESDIKEEKKEKEIKEEKSAEKLNKELIQQLDKWVEDVSNIEEFENEDVEVIGKVKQIIEKQELSEDNIKDLYKIVEKNIEEEILKHKETEINITDKSELEKEKIEIGTISSLLKEIIEIKEIEKEVKYEDFLTSDGYIVIRKIEKVLKKISISKVSHVIYTNLEDIIISYENKIELIIKQVDECEKNTIETNEEMEQLKEEIIGFTNTLNKIKAKGKIALKQEYEKLSRAQVNLSNRKEKLQEKENMLNEKIEKINDCIIDNFKKFEEVSEYIMICLEEEKRNLDKKIEEALQNINIGGEYYTEKQEKLKKLKEILRIEIK